MPYIDVNISNKLSDSEKDLLKSKLGELISVIPGKKEGGLMIGISDGYSLYYAGQKKEKAAYVSVKMYSKSEFEYKAEFTKQVFDFFEAELGITKDSIYMTFEEFESWASKGVLRGI